MKASFTSILIGVILTYASVAAPGPDTNIVMKIERELGVERKRNAASFYGWSYDLVKLTGELKVQNRLEKTIELEITKELSGEVLESSGKPSDVQTARGLKQVNPKHQLTWTLKLPAGEEQKATYSYQLYIRP